MQVDQIVDLLKNATPKNSCIFQFGSHVYESNDEKSDFDFVIINLIGNAREELSLLQQEHNFDVHLMPWETAFKMLNDHHPMMIETFYLPARFKIQEVPIFLDDDPWYLSWELDKTKLRKSFSKVSSNSWVKAKKKLVVEEDYDLRAARKSLYHSFRLLDLGIQIGQGNMEPDFTSSNDILEEVNSLENHWSIWDATFRARHNALLTKFRQICPK